MVALRKSAPRLMTVAEFLDWDPRDAHGRRWQLIDGVPVAMAPAADRHGSIQSELGGILRNHLIATNRPCRVVTAGGIIPHARANRNFRIPDFVVTCAPPGATVMVPGPVSAGRNSVSRQRDDELEQYLDLHHHPERSGNPRFVDSTLGRCRTAAPDSGRRLAEGPGGPGCR